MKSGNSEKYHKKRFNVYKLITFILISLILLVVLAFGAIKILDNTLSEGVMVGQENAVNIILNEVNEKGFIDINLGNNQSVTLVPKGLESKYLVNDIFNSVNGKGFVQISADANNSLVLVPYQPEK